jgi:PKD repeat protein
MQSGIRIFLFLFFGLWINSLDAQIKTIPYQQLPTSGGSPTGSNMFFGASMSASTLTISFAGPSDRWIAIGFGTAMPNTDALIYSVGQSVSPHPLGWNDYYISSYSGSGVANDAIQNWTILSNNVASGQRTVVATRTLNTGDANDAVIQYTAAALSVVWARSSSPDYTIAYHGSTNRANNISLPWLVAPTASFVVNSSSVCSGSSVSFTNQSTGGQLSYLWNFQGGSPATSTLANPIVSYASPGTYSVSLVATNSLGTNTYSQNNFISVTPTVAPGITILQISGSNPMCAGANISFSASPGNGGNAPVYQWKVNGVSAGTNSPLFTTNTFTNTSVVNCVMTSNALCSSPLTASSSVISVTVNSTAPSSISIGLSSGSNPMCSGATTGFSASPFNGGNAPVYQWKVNNINAGNNSPNFTSAAFLNGDQVTCELSSNSTCASNTLGLSNAITMSVSSVLVPSVSVSIAQGSNPTCAGSPLSFSASVVNGGLAPAYQWQVNGASVGNNSPLYSTILNNSSTITCLMISSSSCANPQSVLSSALAFTVNPIPPIPGITASGSLSFCEGDSVILFSSSPTGNIWSNGANTSSILVNTSGTYTVTQTTNSCMSLPSLPVSVSVHPLPVCSIAPVGPFCVEDAPVVLQGLPAGGAFSGTGVNGNVFTPSLSPPGNVSLLYQYTDANNCQDTSLFTVMVSECLGLSGEKSQRESVLVYPNPASGLLHVHSALSEIKIIRIINLNGKEVLHEFLTENSTQYILNLSSLANGIYSMKVDFGEQTNTYKLCVMK